ncbi:hypothetical protein EYF80_011389 [Liparis tanakae]|uniref:Uncharacterized protein n=1 Tax=Liparis tanakae TaxID=230148 RepID=A0A4Z2IKR6_9TELE|nr:hypothetical protein EYF80_011389 [Liparis tanakae]
MALKGRVGAGAQGETGIMVARMRARQSATSLLGAQAKAERGNSAPTWPYTPYCRRDEEPCSSQRPADVDTVDLSVVAQQQLETLHMVGEGCCM